MPKKVDFTERRRIAAQFAIDGKRMWEDPNQPRKGWKQNAADHLDVTPQTVSNWLSGRTPIPASVLGLVAQTLSKQDNQPELTGEASSVELPRT